MQLWVHTTVLKFMNWQDYTLHYPKFTKNLICLQISSSKFQLQSKHDLQITHQIEQFSVMQQNIMKRHSKNQVIMSSYSRNQQIRIQTTKTAKEKLLGSIFHLVKQYQQKLVITLLIVQISTSQKIINFTVFSTEIKSHLATAAPKKH